PATAPSAPYTLSLHDALPIFVPLLQKTGFDPRKDLAPVTQVATNVMILVAHAQTAGSLAELVDQARAQPGRLSYASIGNGSLLQDRKSTRLNSSHRTISYAVF